MRTIWLIIIFLSILGCSPEKEKIQMKPPIASIVPFSFEIHGKLIHDEYAWLRDALWPKVENSKILDYLNAENNYTEHYFKDLATNKKKIFEELKARIKLADQTPYIKKDDYFYYSRTEADKEYPIHCRKLGSTDAEEQIILDVNALALNKKFTRIGTISISPDHKLLSYSVDHMGDENYTIKILNLETEQYLADEIPKTIGSIVWHEEMPGFFYTPTNENWRHDKVMFHALGSSQDKLVMHEPDILYNLSVQKSGSREYIFIGNNGHDNNSIYVINMHDHAFTPKLIREKRAGIFYDLEHNGDYFYLKTNDGAKNFKLSRLKISEFTHNQGEAQTLEDYIVEDAQKYLSSFDVSKKYLLLNYRDNNTGLPLIRVKELTSGSEQSIHFPDAAFVGGGECVNFAENDLRIGYSSLGRPATTYSYDFATDKLSVLKTQEIPSGFDPDDYMVERIFANNDGVRVPVSIFYKKSLFKKDGSNPVYLYGYGSYGISMPASFRNTAVSLADRGFVFALSHIRGGDDLGHDWYEAAKFLNKKRTFEDFISVAETLIKDKYTKEGNIVISGGSAGGMLIGYVINQRPELFRAAIAHAPFVDVLNTMLDGSLPLTPGEYKEWGNPKEEKYFDYMLSYSPYENVKKQSYPSLYVTAGLSDPRVGYWEAAKWVAKLRANKEDQNILLLKTNMDAGHTGASGRFDYLKEVADDLVFIFNIFGVEDKAK